MEAFVQFSDVIVEILSEGILHIRALGYAGKAEDCGTEADHIHNLPRLLAQSSINIDEILYYQRVCRPLYVNAIGQNIGNFEQLWKKLDLLIGTDIKRE